MIGFLSEWLLETWNVLALSGPWLLLGFLLAGFIRVVLPASLIYRHLGKDNWRSVLVAATAGIPIPLCSCSVLPTAMSLRKSGASKGATTSFLIATPETGVDSIGITYALMDPVLTVVRPLAAMVTALGSGIFVNVLVRFGLAKGPSGDPAEAAPSHSHDRDHDHDHDHDHEPEERGTVAQRAVRYAFGPLLDDLTPWFLIGLALSGLIAVLVPDGFFQAAAVTGWVAMLAMLVIGVPMYVCATASTPIAAALVAKGLDPGAALVFLLAGPATNIATMAVVRGFLGGRVLVAYLTSIAGFSLLAGSLLGPLYGALGLNPVVNMSGAAESGLGVFTTAGGAVMLGLLCRSALRLGLPGRWARTASEYLSRVGIDTSSATTRFACVAVVLAGYLSTSIDVVRAGETGFLTRFGRVVSQADEPGLVLHLPFPFERFEAVRSEEVRRVDIGLDPGDEAFTSEEFDSEFLVEWEAIEVTTGDETLLRVPFAVHYDVSDAYRHRYEVVDTIEMVVSFSSAALQRAIARRTTDEALVEDRRALESDVARLLQEELESIAAGVGVVGVRIGSVHAPDSVHAAFRDVASAAEDKLRFEQEAEASRISILTQARGLAAERVEQARADAITITSESEGRARALETFIEAYREAPDATLLSLRMDSLERSLTGTRIVFQVGEGVQVTTVPPALEGDE